MATFGGPLVIGMMLHTFFNLIDFYICARLGTDAINAVGICDIIMMVPAVVANGLCTASIAVIARNYGLKKFYRASLATWHAFILMLVLGALTAAVGYIFGDTMLRAFVRTPREMEWAHDYLMYSAGGSVAMFLMLQVTSVLRASGESMWPMIIFFMSTFLNVLGDILLVFGYAPLGIAAMGVPGAALASVLARLIGVGAGAYLLFKGRQSDRITLRRLRISLGQFWLLIKIGLPSSAQMVSRVVAVYILASIVDSVDFQARPGYIICVRLDMLAMFWCIGWGAGASTLVGQNLGAGHRLRAARSAWYSVLLGGVMMLAVSLVFLQWSDELIGFFAESSEGIETPEAPGAQEVEYAKAVGRSYLGYVAPTYFFVAVSIILALSLNGAGSTRTPLLIDSMLLLGIMIPAAFMAKENGPETLWMVIAGANVVLALPYAIWFRFGHWYNKKI